MSELNNKRSALAVDLDGTLLCGDLSFLSLSCLLRRNPLYLLLVPLWLLLGKAGFKQQVASRVRIDPASLHYHAEILDFVRSEHAGGRHTILATGSDATLVRPIADHLGCFDEVICSDGRNNRTGDGKRTQLVAQYGVGGYDYIGNSKVDIPVWRDAGKVLVASSSEQFTRSVAQQFQLERVFTGAGAGKPS